MEISILALTTLDSNKSWEWMSLLWEHVEKEKNRGPKAKSQEIPNNFVNKGRKEESLKEPRIALELRKPGECGNERKRLFQRGSGVTFC